MMQQNEMKDKVLKVERAGGEEESVQALTQQAVDCVQWHSIQEEQ